MDALEGLKAGVGLANPVEVVERACVGPWGPTSRTCRLGGRGGRRQASEVSGEVVKMLGG